MTQGGDQAEVVGYVLGRMEDKQLFPGIRDPRINNTPTGHVTSLAVLPGYRRCGVAHQLMTRLHEQVTFFRRSALRKKKVLSRWTVACSLTKKNTRTPEPGSGPV